MANYAIYVPGLGDHHSYGQPAVLKLWRLFGVKVRYMPLGWRADGQTFADKLDRLLTEIDKYDDMGHKVSLVGVSAGASAVLNAFAERPDIKSVICISGKINNPQSIGDSVYRKNPAFKESVFLLQKSLPNIKSSQRKHILSIHPLSDKTVPIGDTIISGAHEMQVNVSGHIQSIFYCLVFRARAICRFILNA